MDLTQINAFSKTLRYHNFLDVRYSAITLLDATGLSAKGWRFAWNKSKRSLGLCVYSEQTIFLSSTLWNAIDKTVRAAQTRETLLHEIAHALVGPGQGHGRVWKNMARTIGSTSDRCYDPKILNADKVGYKWRITCLGKGCTVQVHQSRLTLKRQKYYANGIMRCNRCGSHEFKVTQLR